jgi:hypothetical protein
MKLTKTNGAYVGLTDALVKALPATAPELEERMGLPRRRAATILDRLALKGERVIILGAVVRKASGRYCKLYGRPEHLNPAPRKRGPR